MLTRVLVVFLTGSLLLTACATVGKTLGENTTLHTLTSGGLQRAYALHVPPHLPERPVPLVLVFHGGGGTPDFAERDTGFSAVADREGFLVAYPAAYRKNWNDGRELQAVAAQRDKIDDVAFITALLDDIARRHKIDGKRVYATGLSNGGVFSHYLGAKLANRLAAIAPVAGGIAEPFAPHFAPTAPVAVLLTHGTDDTLVPYAGGDITVFGSWRRGRILGVDAAAAKWAQHNQTALQPTALGTIDAVPDDNCNVIKQTYPNGQAGTEVMVYRLEGAGHTWPNGKQYLPQSLVGTVCREFNGADVVWDFFKRHPKL